MTLPVEKKSFLDVADVRRQVNLIQQLLTEVMKPEEHFGKIPGSGKPTLYKAGAEKILFTFRLACKYHILKSVHEKNFISYIIECTLTHIPTGNFVASGIGSCNSREKKYRYTFIPTNKRPTKEEADKLKAQGLGKWKKSGNDWRGDIARPGSGDRRVEGKTAGRTAWRGHQGFDSAGEQKESCRGVTPCSKNDRR